MVVAPLEFCFDEILHRPASTRPLSWHHLQPRWGPESRIQSRRGRYHPSSETCFLCLKKTLGFSVPTRWTASLVWFDIVEVSHESSRGWLQEPAAESGRARLLNPASIIVESHVYFSNHRKFECMLCSDCASDISFKPSLLLFKIWRWTLELFPHLLLRFDRSSLPHLRRRCAQGNPRLYQWAGIHQTIAVAMSESSSE